MLDVISAIGGGVVGSCWDEGVDSRWGGSGSAHSSVLTLSLLVVGVTGSRGFLVMVDFGVVGVGVVGVGVGFGLSADVGVATVLVGVFGEVGVSVVVVTFGVVGVVGVGGGLAAAAAVDVLT